MRVWKVKIRITARKYQGDDLYSWAVFIDGRPFVTGLSRREVPYYRAEAEKILEKRGVEAAGRATLDPVSSQHP